MNGYQRLNLLMLPLGAAFAVALTLRLADTPGPYGGMWQPAAVLFGVTAGYVLVVLRRPRRLHGGIVFLVTGLVWLGAAIWIGSHNSDLIRPLMLFVSTGACLSGVLLADDSPVSTARVALLHLLTIRRGTHRALRPTAHHNSKDHS